MSRDRDGDDWGEVPPLLTISEVAKLLRVTTRTIARWQAEGRLRARKLTPGKSGRVVFSRAEIRRFVEDPTG